jgi:hypothetical protein
MFGGSSAWTPRIFNLSHIFYYIFAVLVSSRNHHMAISCVEDYQRLSGLLTFINVKHKSINSEPGGVIAGR